MVGVGILVAAPVLLPVVGAVIRPLAKGLIKTSLMVGDAVQGVVAAGSEQLSDLTTEARTEHAARPVRKK